MGFMENLQEMVNKGVDASRDLLEKASDKAKELGEKGVLNYELLQLNNQAHSQAARIGTWVYQKTRLEKLPLDSSDPTLAALMDELARLQGEIDLRLKKLAEGSK